VYSYLSFERTNKQSNQFSEETTMLAVGSFYKITIVDTTETTETTTTWKAKWGVDDIPGAVRSVAMSPDGRFVAAVTDQEQFWRLWHVDNPSECVIANIHDGNGECTCNKTRSGRHTRIYDACPRSAHTQGVCAVNFSPCGEKLVTGSLDKTAIVWNALTGVADLVIKSHFMRVNSVTFSACGTRIASGSWDGHICVWNSTTGALLHLLQENDRNPVDTVQFPPKNHQVVTSTRYLSNVMTTWQLDTGERRYTGGSKFANYSPDGSSIATTLGPASTALQLKDADTGAVRFTATFHANYQSGIIAATFSADGGKIITSHLNGSDIIWDTNTGQELGTIKLKGISFAWGPDWGLKKKKEVAFTMGHHPRLGVESLVLGLDEELLRMILDRV
jgi:WD40 repeat protein